MGERLASPQLSSAKRLLGFAFLPSQLCALLSSLPFIFCLQCWNITIIKRATRSFSHAPQRPPTARAPYIHAIHLLPINKRRAESDSLSQQNCSQPARSVPSRFRKQHYTSAWPWCRTGTSRISRTIVPHGFRLFFSSPSCSSDPSFISFSSEWHSTYNSSQNKFASIFYQNGFSLGQ